MSQSNGRDQPGGQRAMPRFEPFDSRAADPRAVDPRFDPRLNDPRYQDPRVAAAGQPAPAAPVQAAPAQASVYTRPQPAPAAAPAQQAPGGYTYPTPPRNAVPQPPAPGTAYQYMPQGYGPGAQPAQAPAPAPAPYPTRATAQPPQQAAPVQRPAAADSRSPQAYDPRAFTDPRTLPPPPSQRSYQPAQPQPTPAQAVYAQAYPQAQSQAGDPRLSSPQQPMAHDPRAYAPAQAQTQAPAAALRGAHYDHTPAQPPGRGGFDLSAYMPADQQPRQAPPAMGAPADWRGGGAGVGFQPDPRLEPGGPAPRSDEAEEDPLEADEPKRPRGRILMVLGALVLAIAAGGGLAYVYKTFLTGPKNGQPVKVVKGPTDPAKVPPTDPGGRKVANADIKVLDRLSSDNPGDDPGVKRVKPIQIGPNGTVVPPVESKPPPGGAVVSMPGIILRDTGSPPPPPQTSQPQPAPPPQAAPAPSAPPPRGVQITNGGAGQPPAAPLPPQAQPTPPPKQKTAAAPPPPPAATEAPAAPKQPVKKTPPQPPSGVGAAPPKAAASGYVAVLQSLGSEGAALQALADLQQAYPNALDGRMLNVAKYVKPSGETYFRVIAGPPGSKQTADKICADVKAAGGKECFTRPDSDHEPSR